MKKFVLSGSPHSGKTSTLNALQATGYHVIPESALELINLLNDLCGLDRCSAWRKQFNRAWQNLVIARQLALEAQCKADVVFIDSTPIDSLAFIAASLEADEKINPDLIKMCDTLKYDKVFILDTVLPFNNRAETGRLQNLQECQRIATFQNKLYTMFKLPVVKVPLMPLEQRVALILNHLAS